MADMIERYAVDFLKYAKEQARLEEFYTHALILTQRIDRSEILHVPEQFNTFFQLVPAAYTEAVLIKFIDTARNHLGMLDVTVTSAVPLTDLQKADIKNKLIGVFNKQIHMVTKVDSALLGGLRIVAGYTVIDNTIRKKLSDMKKNIYKGVYFKK